MATCSPSILISHPSAHIYGALLKESNPDLVVLEAPDPQSLEHHIEDAEIILAFRFPVEVFDRAKKLKWFQATGAGVDSTFSIRDRLGSVVVTNARGIHGELIADYVMAGATMLHWNMRGFFKDQNDRRWQPRQISPLAEKTIGIVGLGSIGATIASRACSAGMTVLGTKRDVTKPMEGIQLFAPDRMATMLPLCDFVVLALPATADTIGYIGRKELALMRPGAFLINIARGSVVDETALIEALASGGIAGAMLDVFEQEPLAQENPLWDMSNVIVTPHTAGNPVEYERRAFSVFVDNLKRYLNGNELRNIVDLKRGY